MSNKWIPDWATHYSISISPNKANVAISFYESYSCGPSGRTLKIQNIIKDRAIADVCSQIRENPLSERIEHDPALRYKPGRHSVYISPDSKPQSKYHKEIKPGVIVDWYDVAAAFSPKPSKMWEKVCGAVHHAHKKLCRLGSGDKELRQDLVEARDSLDRAIEQLDTWA